MQKDGKQSVLKEKNIFVTVMVIILTAIITLISYLCINDMAEKRCLDRMQEGADTVMSDISAKLSRDSVILNAMAEIITMQDNTDSDSMQKIIQQFAPLTVARQINLLLPGDVIISRTGEKMDVTGAISFEQEAALGEHVTDRMPSVLDENRMVIRHFVPIEKHGEVIGMLYSTTNLEDLPKSLSIDYIYNGTASVYLVDRKNGDLLMDTLHEQLGNINEFDDFESKIDKPMKKSNQELMDGKTGYNILKSDVLGEYLYYYYAPISENEWRQLGESGDLNRWAVAVAVPEKEVMASVYKIRHIYYMMVLLEGILLFVYFVWTLRNTTVTMEKAILEERLIKAENAERAKTMFLSNMSHDIRTPMNAIIGYATLAATNIDMKERVQDYISKILSSSNHLLSLINDILDMSRIESGKVYIEETECSLPDILFDLRNILIHQMNSKQLDFYIDTIDVVDEDIYCDKLHLNQVLLNLLSNAIKFTPAGGTISLIIKQKHGAPKGYASYEIRVKDTGIGMSEEFVNNIFEPFERESTSTVSGIQGTGLGMAIAKNIVDMMGGNIEVFSEQGKGTEFVLSLEFRLQSESKKIEVIKELEGMRALVVDDDYNICDSVTKMLVQLGLRTDWTMSGREAVLHAKQAVELADDFNVYIIDLYMPDLGGLRVVKEIRDAIGDDVPIIILTAYDWSNIENEAREAGVTAFCHKPIFVSTLRDTLISSLCDESESAEPVVFSDISENVKGKRLLLVEDNELNREIAEEILTENGFLIETATDGTEAVEIVGNAEEGYFDLILMDVQMPIMNGYDATRAIRKLENPKLANIPIIAMTANAFDEDKQNAMESGMNDHIAKPLDIDTLFDVLRKHLADDEK
ncbi:MAG: response regulator [Lachnospiraceae bacterium]|nr:response regulator [Lachnospiraceae bacterium]